MKTGLKRGERVQVWDEEKKICLGWGIVIELANPITNPEKEVVFVMVGKECLWGDKYHLIPEAEAIKISERILKDIRQAATSNVKR